MHRGVVAAPFSAAFVLAACGGGGGGGDGSLGWITAMTVHPPLPNTVGTHLLVFSEDAALVVTIPQ